MTLSTPSHTNPPNLCSSRDTFILNLLLNLKRWLFLHESPFKLSNPLIPFNNISPSRSSSPLPPSATCSSTPQPKFSTLLIWDFYTIYLFLNNLSLNLSCSFGFLQLHAAINVLENNPPSWTFHQFLSNFLFREFCILFLIDFCYSHRFLHACFSDILI